jgi:hypothetical protein
LNVEGMTYAQLREQIEAVHGKFSFGHLTKWAKHATDADLHAAASDLLSETRPEYLLTDLRLFFRRPFPLSSNRIIEIADTGDERLSHAALHALAAVQHSAVRDFGIDLLRRRRRLGNAFRLFELNYSRGDHRIFMQVFNGPPLTLEETHGAGFDLRKVYDKNDASECSEVLNWVYENTPCGLCRHGIVRILHKSGCMTNCILQECLHDSYPGTRAFARTLLNRE